MRLIPNNWHEFQHYKHRSPPWIKFHKKLLDNMLYHRLPIASKALAPLLWLLASESDDGEINKTIEEIAFRLRMSEKDVSNALKPLIDNEFFIDASNVIAIGLHDATTEKNKVEKSASKAISFNAESNCFENIDDAQKKLWKEAYPAVNLEIELSKAIVWLKANPTKKKSNYNKFLSGWFSRCQDSGGTKVGIQTKEQVSFI